jgi:hypothetical protein
MKIAVESRPMSTLNIVTNISAHEFEIAQDAERSRIKVQE